MSRDHPGQIEEANMATVVSMITLSTVTIY